MSNVNFTREFFDLVRSIGECKSKQEEDRLILLEIAHLKKRFPEVSQILSLKLIEKFNYYCFSW